MLTSFKVNVLTMSLNIYAVAELELCTWVGQVTANILSGPDLSLEICPENPHFLLLYSVVIHSFNQCSC